ncbi:META domain-containing protein [Sphingobacterium psychroaquaticum]|uniref:META domain-containing protein n=1 Tax=Sphingobacterium psychroaquaticum TaxID=561061 RepID=UPI00106AB633|nr:META domain-containing protein [Sphingobacterium psychroaquaticum]QBQ42216.1 META domain-containing protein [Sphingobacterium psychroaquaticum]
MRKMNFGALVAMVLLSAGCATNKPTVPAPGKDQVNIVGKKWQLIELNGKAVPATINGKTPYLELNASGGRYEASGGCNGMGGEYTLAAGNRVKFTRGMSTMMACPDMSAEQGLGRLFETADNYAVSGNILSFSKARMAPIAKFKLMEDQSASLTGTWELDYISGPRIAFDGLYPGKKPTLIFEAGEKRVKGNGSCNNFTSQVDISGASIKFGPVAGTKMACEGQGEPLFFQTLEKVTSFGVSGNTLNLVMGDIAVMRFKKK